MNPYGRLNVLLMVLWSPTKGVTTYCLFLVAKNKALNSKFRQATFHAPFFVVVRSPMKNTACLRTSHRMVNLWADTMCSSWPPCVQSNVGNMACTRTLSNKTHQSHWSRPWSSCEKYKLVTYDCQQIFPNIQVQCHWSAWIKIDPLFVNLFLWPLTLFSKPGQYPLHFLKSFYFYWKYIFHIMKCVLIMVSPPPTAPIQLCPHIQIHSLSSAERRYLLKVKNNYTLSWPQTVCLLYQCLVCSILSHLTWFLLKLIPVQCSISDLPMRNKTPR